MGGVERSHLGPMCSGCSDAELLDALQVGRSIVCLPHAARMLRCRKAVSACACISTFSPSTGSSVNRLLAPRCAYATVQEGCVSACTYFTVFFLGPRTVLTAC